MPARRLAPLLLALAAAAPAAGQAKKADEKVGLVRELRGHDGAVLCAAISPDGKLIVSGGADKTLRLWDAATGKEQTPLKGFKGPVRAVEFLPTGKDQRKPRLALVRTGEELMLIDLSSPKPATVASYGSGTISQAVSRDAKLVACGFHPEGQVRVWEATTGKGVGRFAVTVTPPALALSPDGKAVVAASDELTLRWYDVKTGKPQFRYKGHTSDVIGVAFRPDGKSFVSASWDGTVRLWDRERESPVKTLKRDEVQIFCLVLSADGKRALTASKDNVVRLWDIDGDVVLEEFGGHTERVNGIAFSADGRRAVSASSDETVRVWALPK
jgi:WD40 repeat protein